MEFCFCFNSSTWDWKVLAGTVPYVCPCSKNVVAQVWDARQWFSSVDLNWGNYVALCLWCKDLESAVMATTGNSTQQNIALRRT
eukprot:scaffold2563_cov124-Cylindrotheca_fusiformis.AAC.10